MKKRFNAKARASSSQAAKAKASSAKTHKSAEPTLEETHEDTYIA